MPIREDQLNGRIATIIRECIAGLQWAVDEENDGKFATSNRRADILINRPSPEPPIVLENEYHIANIAADCRNKLGQTLKPEHGGQTVATVVGIFSPPQLQDAANGDEAESLLRSGVQLQYAVYTGTPGDYRRFPRSGFITGNVRNLVEFIRPAAEPADIIRQASETLANGAAIAAYAILNSANSAETGRKIGEKLRQPWPTENAADPKQASANRTARTQTANMAATIIINALAYQQNLDGYAGIRGLKAVRAQTANGRLTKDTVSDEFDNILSVNFWPIFHVANELLLQIPAPVAVHMMDQMAQTADGIIEAIRHNDIAGTVFQQLIADRKTLKTYYTTPEATVLMAHLAIPEDLDWADPETLRNFRIADYACGSGGIMLSSYQRVRELHRLHGGNPDDHHARMMQECLTACDIMPAGVHLTASLLSSVAPTVPYEGTRCILFPFGGQRKIDRNGQRVLDQDGNPVKETNRYGNPIVHLGSIALLNLTGTQLQAVLPPDEQAALGARGQSRSIDVPMTPVSQNLVAMNPPFTKPTKHGPRNSADNVDPKNPAFAAFGTTDPEQEAMKDLERRLGLDTISDGNAGLGTTFAAIANNMVKAGGRIALILPTAAMIGGSYDPDKRKGQGQAYSWQRLRNLLCDNYDQIVVLSIAQPRKKDSAFSADTDFADCMVIARRIRSGEYPGREAHFVSLKAGPATKLEAQETARVIKSTIRETVNPGSYNDIRIGDDVIGAVSLEAIGRNRRWNSVRIANPTLVERLRRLEQGVLRLPQSAEDINLPIAIIRGIGRVGPLHRDIAERGPFAKVDGCRSDHEYPMLWNHYPNQKKLRIGKDPQMAMLTRPDCHGTVKQDLETAAARFYERHATHLHINIRFQFNGNSTAAAYTPQRSLGGSMWPTLKLATPELEKALCVWLNSTLGMAIYWLESDRGQDGRGGTTVTAIPDIPVLDVTQLNAAQLAAAAQIFNDLKELVMKPANEAWHDPVRQELDARLFREVLDLDDAAVERLGILRRQWCREPTVTAAKKTGPPD